MLSPSKRGAAAIDRLSSFVLVLVIVLAIDAL